MLCCISGKDEAPPAFSGVSAKPNHTGSYIEIKNENENRRQQIMLMQEEELVVEYGRK